MYIEFLLPSGAGAPSARFVATVVSEHLAGWSARYNIAYRTKAVKNTYRITFDHDSYYTLFVSSWTPPQVGTLSSRWFNYRLVEPMAKPL